MTSFITISVAFVSLITAIASFYKAWYELKQVEKGLNKIEIVANPTEMREALRMPLEGTWNVAGSFTKYQNDNNFHFSKGVVNFTWDDIKKRYSIIYTYSVKKEHCANSLITAVCTGYAIEELALDKINHFIVFHMNIDDFTIDNSLIGPRSQAYTMRTKYPVKVNKELHLMEFDFITPITDGIIRFNR